MVSTSYIIRYGGERYEKRDLQIRVRQRFSELQSLDEKAGRVPWHVVGKLLNGYIRYLHRF